MPQELSNTVWACATIGFGYDESSGSNNHNDYIHVTSESPKEDKTLMYDTLDIIADNAVSWLEKFKVRRNQCNYLHSMLLLTKNLILIDLHQQAQELNNLAWGFARLGHRTEKADDLFRGIAGQYIGDDSNHLHYNILCAQIYCFPRQLNWHDECTHLNRKM